MQKSKPLAIAIFLTLLCSCQPKQEEHVTGLALDWEALASKIIERSDLQTGERVIMVGQPGHFDPLVKALTEKILKTGAVYLGTISVNSTLWPESWKTEFIKSAMASPGYDSRSLLDNIDLGIMLPGASPADLPYATLQGSLRQGIGRTIHFHWSGAFDFNGRVSPMTDEVNAVYQEAILNTDYDALGSKQLEFETAARKDWIVVTTPEGTNIRFRIGDRPVTRQDGDASKSRTSSARNLIDREVELPAGAVRMAPLEETVEGTIFYPDLYWGNQKVEGLVIAYKEGMITDLRAKVGKDSVEAVLNKGGLAAHSFREFALGFNPLLKVQRTYLPHYGYGAGVVRLSLGNNQELGGSVTSGEYARNTFFTNATVMIGADVWVKDGKLVK